MNIKNLIIVSFSSLIVSIGLIFGLLYVLQPQAETPAENEAEQKPDQIVKKTLTGETVGVPLNLAENMVSADSLDTLVSRFEEKITEQAFLIDSLKELAQEKATLAEKFEEDYNKLLASIDDDQKQQDNAKSLAKTFETMKTAEIARTVASLDDESLIRIYHSMNSRHRKNLFMALNKDRASRITKKMMTLASE